MALRNSCSTEMMTYIYMNRIHDICLVNVNHESRAFSFAVVRIPPVLRLNPMENKTTFTNGNCIDQLNWLMINWNSMKITHKSISLYFSYRSTQEQHCFLFFFAFRKRHINHVTFHIIWFFPLRNLEYKNK